MLNQFFSSCFSPISTYCFQNSTPEPYPSLTNVTCSQEEVYKYLSTHKINTASGPDGVSSQMLRATAGAITPAITSIFNKSLEQSKVPVDWKISYVTPIPKSGDLSLVSNYRPISLLSLISKILERIIHNKISHFLYSNNLLSNCQFGFRPQSSTQEALLSVTNSWHQMLTKHHQVVTIFFDVRKAFDSVPHNHLISSIAEIGISGSLLKWLSDYLTGRKQQVVLDGITSESVPVTSGVPQGSILGPLLFNIFMNSISNLSFSQNTRLIMYADDILLYKPVDSIADIQNLQQDVDLVLSWMQSHGLTPNISKTKLMPITRSKSVLPINISIYGNAISHCKSVKYLGVIISSNLTWSEHITSICKKTKQHLGLIHRKLYQSPPCVRHQIYRSVILPKLDYCGAVWNPHHALDIAALENVQKFGGRIITKQWQCDYPTLLSILKWKPLSIRRKIQKLKVCYNILNKFSIIPPSVFTLHPHPSPRHLHSQILFRPYVSTSAHKFSFFIDVIPIWNSLPYFIINSPNPFTFKKRVTRYLCF